ncbi:hypothetical protein AAU57_01500 [Nonlabens sp. YIK11]|uniref:redoxin domain-containing protein n=1 Tax=Nonlabens sp. YIK11 TaxID=1453349 RepID=UPI0006DCF064|nr:redoxin domain-containing protein [Nonlabens sp. YIK11]KQC32142.1 hypothetical protein AAU57_01500 [Nonlabens sp. YIK11]
MTNLSKLTLLASCIFFINCTKDEVKYLQLSGRVVDAEYETIILISPNQDVYRDSLIEIPIVEGKFLYVDTLEYPQEMNIAFKESVEDGIFRTMPVFLENEKINLTIYDEEKFDQNEIDGGTLNEEYKNYKQGLSFRFDHKTKPLKDSLSVLKKNGLDESDSAKFLYSALRNATNQDEKVPIYQQIDSLRESGNFYTEPAQKLNDQLEKIREEQRKFQQEYIDNQLNVVGYFLLFESLIFEKEEIDVYAARNTIKLLSERNPNHPYNDLATSLVEAIDNARVGSKYTDFTAPDLFGNEITLSDKMNGEIILLDLWATWCGPCIAKTKTMIPIYEEFKDQGFNIIGVAGEYENTNNLKKFLNREKWPWLNLVELDKKNSIWHKYGVDHGGGGMFLIDKTGIIIAKNPTAEQVKQELELRLL